MTKVTLTAHDLAALVQTAKAEAWDEGWNTGVAYEEARWRKVCNVRLDSVAALPNDDFPHNPYRAETP